MRIVAGLIILLSLSMAVAQSRPDGRPHDPRSELSVEQIQCLDGILGKRVEGKHPTREALEDAFKRCNISGHPHHGHGRPPGAPPNLTQEQISCLESKIGKPDDEQRPTKEDFEAAHLACGIQLPDLPDGGL